MQYRCLASDFDGTLAQNAKVSSTTIDALKAVKSSGRKLVLVTGRVVEDLLHVFPEVAVFDRVVAENGALLYNPGSKDEIRLGEPPPARFVDELRRRGVERISAGHLIVATVQPFESVVRDVIRELGLDLEVILNKGAVMVLPRGVNKGSGLVAALRDLGIPPHNVVAIGDAENDDTLLEVAGCGVAVSNALESLKERADLVTQGDHGAGVEELIRMLVATDLAELTPWLKRGASRERA